MTDRREFLKTLTAAGAASLVPGNAFSAQERVVRVNVRGGAIDVHHHFRAPGMGQAARAWTPDLSLAQMEKFGIGIAILSVAQDGPLLSTA